MFAFPCWRQKYIYKYFLVMAEVAITRVLHFWFRGPAKGKWFFGGGTALDNQIRHEFSDLMKEASSGDLTPQWSQTPQGQLALILLLDQMPRNCFRGQPEAFATDRMAQQVCTEAIEAGTDMVLSEDERKMFYMPLRHAEDIELQKLGLSKAIELGWGESYARSHMADIERYGRFPSRDAALRR